MNIVPQTVQKTPNGERYMDLYSRLLDDRIVILDGEVNDQMASIVIAQLLYLEAQNPDEPINMYINSPGGSVSAGLAIVDIMKTVKPDIVTIGTGLCASMASVILACGTKGHRGILPNGEVMIHQPLGGAKGQSTDILITARHIEKTRKRLVDIYADVTGKDPAEIDKDIERDNWLGADEAIAYGLVDFVVQPH